MALTRPKSNVVLIAVLVLASSLDATPNPANSKPDNVVVYDNADDNSNNLFPYDPIVREMEHVVATARNNKNKLSAASFELERESTNSNQKKASVSAATDPQAEAEQMSGSPNLDKIRSIAYNSREVRLVGPEQKEVEMKDDVASKIVVALENLSKEATDVWDQVNGKLDKGWNELKRSEVWGKVNDQLDKGWTDFKSMVERVAKPPSKTN